MTPPTAQDHITVTHVGSLPRPAHLLELNEQLVDGTLDDDGAYAEALEHAVADVVRRQCDLGIDVVGDGEYSHVARKYDFSAWRTYVFDRVGGLELVEGWSAPPRPAVPGQIELSPINQRRDWLAFSDAYSDPRAGVAQPNRPGASDRVTVCRGPITYQGRANVERDIDNFKAALAAAGQETGFMNAVAPASFARFANEYYDNDEELIFACAEAMREEYSAIIEAGLLLQLDDPAIADNWDLIDPPPAVEDYQRFTAVRIEALNHAIRGLPAERIRFHLCWGSWHGPHVTDIPLTDLIDLLLSINAGMYSFEGANARHEHEWRLWEQIKLPEGKILIPGVVSHATNVVEHPELIADRLCRLAEIVGRENVMASTDCGLGGRIHEQIAWAKLEALVQGAQLATRRLWR